MKSRDNNTGLEATGSRVNQQDSSLRVGLLYQNKKDIKLCQQTIDVRGRPHRGHRVLMVSLFSPFIFVRYFLDGPRRSVTRCGLECPFLNKERIKDGDCHSRCVRNRFKARWVWTTEHTKCGLCSLDDQLCTEITHLSLSYLTLSRPHTLHWAKMHTNKHKQNVVNSWTLKLWRSLDSHKQTGECDPQTEHCCLFSLHVCIPQLLFEPWYLSPMQ